ncbi:MAG TPA: FAD-dependent oxidoreductase, partial [Longimicrobiales bacterium]|nr:FAD-dependent oxidoreductase [Longimicrobiales bacterium]
MIERNPAAASTTAYDLIVVGGGIYGSMVALEAARRGFDPLLLERDDFGQHTSGSWLGILHGGLRYLQTLDLPRHRVSTSERRWFLATFPDLVEPLRIVMPLYGDGLRRASVMGAALRLNDALSWYRNRGVRPDRSLPQGRLVSAEQTLRLLPATDPRNLRSGAIWYDGVTHHPQRLLMETLRWAVGLGASALNYIEAVELLQEAGKVRGVV